MSQLRDSASLSNCGCCADTAADAAEQARRHNPPGQDRLDYRIGRHPELFRQLISRLHRWQLEDGENVGNRPLQALTTRALDDPAIGMLDAWAVVGDVLTFYQERIANEGFLRTATERRSILEMARAVGYELAPGVAAETWLEFRVDDAESAPDQSPVPAGTQVQSLPASQDELPQTFETAEDFVAHSAWNALQPQRQLPQVVSVGASSVLLEGTASRLAAGDYVIVEADGDGHPRRVREVQVDNERGTTQVIFSGYSLASSSVTFGVPESFDPTENRRTLSRHLVDQRIFARTWQESELQAFLAYHEWLAEDVVAFVDDLRAATFEGATIQAPRERLGVFGHNAPRQETLPTATDTRGGIAADPYEFPWDGANARTVWQASQGGVHSGADLFLERVVPDIVTGSWAVLEVPLPDGALYVEAHQVLGTFDDTRVDYAISGKTTALDLSVGVKRAEFFVRRTTVHVRSESLALAPVPLRTPVRASRTSIRLDRMVLGLRVGQALSVRGLEDGTKDRQRSEIVVLADIRHSGGYTRLTFERGLKYSYQVDSLVLNANVLRATHGETVAGAVLGSGDGSKQNQVFVLPRSPLTHLSAATARGVSSELAVRVDGVKWQEEPSLYGLPAEHRGYTVRIQDDATARLIFGDGKSGARLPTGQENVTATFRHGLGFDGEVGADSLTLLKTRPFGIRGVSNPLPARGADDPETLDGARDNAPLTVLTLDRIVSLRDYEDFARSYPGIGKAKATTVWTGLGEHIHLTVADAKGRQVEPLLLERLAGAIESARDPLHPISLAVHQPLSFFVAAGVLLDPAYAWQDVMPAVESALLAAFSFEQRNFAQPVTGAEVVQVIHSVAGVTAVDLDVLSISADAAASSRRAYRTVLDALPARYDHLIDQILAAQLLLIHRHGMTLRELTP